MNSRIARRATFQLVVAFLVALVIGVALDVALAGDDREQTKSSFGARAEAFLGLHDVLARLGVEVRRHRASYGALPDPERTILLTLEPLAAAPGSQIVDGAAYSQARALKSWVEAGGVVVVGLPGRPRGGLVDSLFERDDGAELANPRGEIRGLASGRRKFGAGTDGSGTDVLEVVGPGSFRSRWKAPTSAEASSAPAYLRAIEGTDAVEHVVFVDAEDTPVVTLRGEPIVRRTEVGAGVVWTCASAYPFANLALGRHETAPFVVELLRAAGAIDGRAVVFDEYCHGLEERRSGWYWITRTTLGWPAAGLILVLLSIAWRHAIRFGPPSPEAMALPRAKEEFVRNLAAIAHSAGRRRGAARRILDAWAARLRTRRGPADGTDEPLRAELAPFAHRLDSGEPLDEAAFVRFVRDLESTVAGVLEARVDDGGLNPAPRSPITDPEIPRTRDDA